MEGKKTEVKNNPPEKDVKIEKASEKEPEIKKESETEKTKVREERGPKTYRRNLIEKIKYTFQKLCGTIKKAGEKKEFLTAFLTYEKHQRAFEAVKKELCHLLHVLKPKSFRRMLHLDSVILPGQDIC